MKTLVIGIDGGEWDVIRSMMKNGNLPNLAALDQSGISGELTSSTPPVSAPAWNSILTGTNPGKHGIFDFVSYDDTYQRVPNNASDRALTPFWTILEDHGVSTNLFKFPFTYPTDEVSGYMVAGFPTPQSVSDYTYPQEISERVGPLEDLFENGTLIQESRLKEFREDLDSVARHQTDGFLNLHSDFETEFGTIVYEGVDRAQHTFWKYFDDSHPRHSPDSPLVGELKTHYKVVDEQIGRILDEIDDNCDVIVLSDHGFGPLNDYIYIDEWLKSEGFLTWDETTLTGAKGLLQTVLQSGWKLAGMTNTKTTIKSTLPSWIFDAGRSLQVNRDIDWNETTAFFTTLSGKAVLLNIEDRFAKGTVTQAEYDEHISVIQESLHSINHPETGKPIIESVLRGDEVFEGSQLNKAPDLIVIPKSGYSLKGGRSRSLLKPSDEGAEDRSGDHRKEGILIASGPSFERGTIEGAKIVDIAPTLLYLHQTPIPTMIDGEILEGLFKPAVTSELEEMTTEKYNTVTRESHEMTEEEQTDIESRLDDLGYL